MWLLLFGKDFEIKIFEKRTKRFKVENLYFRRNEYLSIVNGHIKKRNYEWSNRKGIGSETDNE